MSYKILTERIEKKMFVVIKDGPDFNQVVGLGGLGVTCWPRDSRFAVSNPAEIDGFFQDVSTSSPGGTLS